MSPAFAIGHEEDVSEFILALFDHFVNCLSSHLSMSSIHSLKPTIVDQTFTIKFTSIGQCSSCLNIFKKNESARLLFIEIEKLNHLTDALAHYVGLETINGFLCSYCKESTAIEKRITVDELSPVLIVNFKRCTFSVHLTKKLLHQVTYNELLDVSSYMSSHILNSNHENKSIHSSNNYLYKLYAVINHVGNDLNSGHYFSYIKTSNNLWFLVDDMYCRAVSLDEVLNRPEALILFYGRVYGTPTNLSTPHHDHDYHNHQHQQHQCQQQQDENQY